MKKSNKILMVIFLTAILIVAGIHVSLYAKYKSGNVSAYTEQQPNENLETYPLSNRQQVRLENIGTVLVYVSATPSLKYEKGQKDIKVTEEGGVLVVSAPKWTTGDGSRDVAVRIYADSSLLVSLKNSRAILYNTGDSNSHLNIVLDDARLVTSDDTPHKLVMDGLNVSAVNQSEIRLNEIRINKLALNLQRSVFAEDKSAFQEIQLIADDS